MHFKFCLLLILMFSIIYTSSQQENTAKEICELNQKSCKECIRAHPECSWCFETTNDTQQQATRQTRCRTLSENQKFCQAPYIENPLSTSNELRNEPFSQVTNLDNLANLTVIQLRPQSFDIKLRQGISQKVNLTFRRVVDYPLDLYYVMDLSFSMADDLATLQNLGSGLAESIRNLTNNVRLGFGTFVDKVMLPYASTVPDQLQNPCLNTDDEFCAPVFGFRHQLEITSNEQAFVDAVRGTNISGNIDSPEGGFDALMQIAVCQDEIKWRPESLRVILFTSDASPHVAMDGKLAAILDINDMQCHLEKNVHKYYPDFPVYAMSKILDYPSVGQLKKAFTDQKIQPVFAVTEEVFPIYQKLAEILFPAYADILDSNSGNVVDLISRSYNQIRARVQLNDPNVPENIDISWRVLCPGETEWMDNSLLCNNVTLENEVIFEFSLMSKGCPEVQKNDSIRIDSNTIQDVVTFNIEYLCDCDCEADTKFNYSQCSYKGNLECGVCACEDGIEGMECQCSQTTNGPMLEQNCTEETYERGVTVLCNDNGFCECGKCQCNEGFYGKYCECQNSGCNSFGGLICGGPARGICQNCPNNRQCNCTNGWTLNVDGSDGVCRCHEMFCRENETSVVLCSGRGTCNCDRCNCSDFYGGNICQDCQDPRCLDIDGGCSGLEIRACAVCVYDADIQNQDVGAACRRECLDMGIAFRIVGTLPNCQTCLNGVQTEICRECDDVFSQDPAVHVPTNCMTNPFSDRTCNLQYQIVWNKVQTQYVVFVKRFEQSDCPKVDPLTIVLPVVGGILFVGIIALIIWKILQTIRDKHEYQKFIQETQNAKWSAGNNQLYVDPNARVTNPMFIGN